MPAQGSRLVCSAFLLWSKPAWCARHGPYSMKRHLDLRTGRPVWYAYRTPQVPTETLVRDCESDVVVVGMGISGSMIAEALSAEGQSVIAIDRRGLLRGSTSATT